MNWSSTRFEEKSIQSLVFSGSTLVAGINGSGIFRSTDNGTTWTVLSNDLSKITVQCIVVSGSNLYARTEENGAYVSNNGGTTWRDSANGLTILSIPTIAVSLGNIFVGTLEGVFLSSDNGNSWKSVQNEMPYNFILPLIVLDNHLFAVVSTIDNVLIQNVVKNPIV